MKQSRAHRTDHVTAIHRERSCATSMYQRRHRAAPAMRAIDLRAVALSVISAGALLGMSGCNAIPRVNFPDVSMSDFASIFPSGIFGSDDDDRFLQSGTIIISRQVPDPEAAPQPTVLSGDDTAPTTTSRLMAPLVGYFPPGGTFVPAENETWIEINRQRNVLSVFRGKELVKEAKTEGSVGLPEGDYVLRHKQSRPLWYAPNDYFKKRQLLVPDTENRLRYRRGALGQFALYPTTTFPIHCGPIWSEDVGGLRVSPQDMASIYHLVPLGTPVVIK